MKKNEVFTFKTPNEDEITAIVIDSTGFEIHNNTAVTTWFCYTQNRLFLSLEKTDIHTEQVSIEYCIKTLVEYAILPDYDAILESYLSKKSCEKEINALIEK